MLSCVRLIILLFFFSKFEMVGSGWRRYFEFPLSKRVKTMDYANYAIEFTKINVESLVTFSNT